MPCEPIMNNGKMVGFICSRSRGKPKAPPCYKCGKPSTKLCDFRDHGTRKHKDDYGREHTTEWAYYTRAIHQFPNVLWVHHADMIAAHIVGV